MLYKTNHVQLYPYTAARIHRWQLRTPMPMPILLLPTILVVVVVIVIGFVVILIMAEASVLFH